jgi:phytoene dehydrogenase-like protein
MPLRPNTQHPIPNTNVIVIGAGHNGLIAACYLAKAGKKVLVLERRDIVGGACVTEEVWPGYHVSVGAYLCSLLQPQIIIDLNLRNFGFDVYKRETAGFAPFPDGSSLFLYADPGKTREWLAQFCSARDVGAFFAFEADVERAAQIIEPWLDHEAPSDDQLRQAFDRAGCANLYEQFITGSVRKLLDDRFEDDRLKTVLATDGLIGSYAGPSTPGTAYVLLHHYMGLALGSRGAWGYVWGGMGRITQALAQALVSLGGSIRTDAPVKSILCESLEGMPGSARRVTGVELENGERIPSDLVLSNADPYRTFALMLGETNTGATWNRLKTHGGASAKINLAVSELPQFTCLARCPHLNSSADDGASALQEHVSTSHTLPLFLSPVPALPSTLYPLPSNLHPEHLGTIHICPSMAALERAWDEASRGYPSSEPMIEMYLQTATDSTLTPPGKHILSLFVQYFPYNLAAELNLDYEREAFADRVVAICGRYAPNVPGSILHRQVLTPRDLEAHFGLTGGHIFHGDLLPPTLFNGRCPNTTGRAGGRTDVEGLYLCGSGAHPGGCVYGAPGRIAAESALADL